MQRCALRVVGALAAVVMVGCAGGGIAAPIDSPVTIETSQMYLTVRNVAGVPLTDVMIAIKPTGVQPEYQMRLRRLDNAQERNLPLVEFRGVDGTPLTLRIVRPRSVRITATDVRGTEYDVELPWQ